MSISFNAKMDYESEPERINTNPSSRCSGKKVKGREKVVKLLHEGLGTNAIQAETGISKPTIIAIRNAEEDNNGFALGTWKKQTALTLSQIVTRGSSRLLEEIENIPAGQLALTIAIITDKFMILQDAPTVIVEHRLKVSHAEINAMITGETIDVQSVTEKP